MIGEFPFAKFEYDSFIIDMHNIYIDRNNVMAIAGSHVNDADIYLFLVNSLGLNKNMHVEHPNMICSTNQTEKAVVVSWVNMDSTTKV